MRQKTEFIRVEKTSNYSIVHNGFLRRKDLSWKAKGIMTYILALPDDWEININELMKHATDGESSFRSGWKELQNAGYVIRRKVLDSKTKKILHWETIVREDGGLNQSEPHSDFPQVGNPHVENPHVENRKLLSTYNTNNLNKQNTNNTNKHLENRFEVLWQLYPNKKGKKKAFDAYKRAVKNGTTDEEIKQGIESYNKEIAYKHTKPMYIAHGSTWFNNQRWLDEYEAPKELGFTSDASQNLNEVEIPEETYQEVNEMYERGEPLNQTIIIQLNEWRKAKGLGAIA